MRFKVLGFAVLTLTVVGIAAAQAPASNPAQGQGPNSTQKLSPDELRHHAVATMAKGGRIQRPTNYDDLTPDQKKFVDDILSGERNSISGGLGILMASPGMGDMAQKALEYDRFNSSNPPRWNELALIITARFWTAQVEWAAHRPAALKAGISPEIVDAIAAGKRPTNMPPDIEAVYNFCTEMLYKRQMSDATFNATKKVVGGDKGVVDLVATMGFYGFMGMLMDTDNQPLPAGAKPLVPLNPNRAGN